VANGDGAERAVLSRAVRTMKYRFLAHSRTKSSYQRSDSASLAERSHYPRPTKPKPATSSQQKFGFRNRISDFVLPSVTRLQVSDVKPRFDPFGPEVGSELPSELCVALGIAEEHLQRFGHSNCARFIRLADRTETLARCRAPVFVRWLLLITYLIDDACLPGCIRCTSHRNGIDSEGGHVATELTVDRHDVGEGHIIFTHSDGEIFHLMWHESGHASVFHNDKVPPGGIGLDVNIPDKPARAKELILTYSTGWP
jgi:hypothetical protein